MNISVPVADSLILNLGKTSLYSKKTTKVRKIDTEPRSKDMSVSTAKTEVSQGPNGASNGTNSLNGTSSNSSKNLSHVPCKFFKQGICQAGNTCPFSHNLDGSLAADKLPCKYFQKGNCKFGLKCALAHFLPDGTRVNSRNIAVGSNFHSRRHSQNNFMNSSNMSMFLNNPTSPTTSNPHSIDNPSVESRPPVTSSHSSNNVANFINVRTKLVGSSYYETANENYYDRSMNGQISTSHSFSGVFGNYTNSNPILLSNSSNLHGLKPLQNGSSQSIFSSTSPKFKIGTPPVNLLQSPPDSNDSLRFLFSSKYDVSPSYSYIQESAIADEDEDEKYENEMNVFEEDYLPASLSDFILTPQELQRRDSRSQSGTLLVRPNINSILGSFKEADEKEKDKTSFSNKDTKIDLRLDIKLDTSQDDVFLME